MKSIVILRVDADELKEESCEEQVEYIKSFLIPNLKNQTC